MWPIPWAWWTTAALAHGIAAFLRHYVFRAGLLDGWAGFVISLSNFEGTFYRYAKHYERKAVPDAEPPLPDSLKR